MLTAALILAATLGVSGTAVVRRYARARGVIDVPNERSSHTVPTPRGGGLAIAVAWLLGMAVLYVGGGLDGDVFAVMALGGGVIAGLGFWDDHRDVPRTVRLAGQVGAAAWAVARVGDVGRIDLGVATVPLGAAGPVAATIGLVWLTNLYNFMDGIDGLAAGEAVVAGVITGALLWTGGASGPGMAAWVLAAAAAGFLVWNWPPAKVFMGDVGSGLLGYGFGVLALAGNRATGLPLAVLLLPLGVFIADATFTLVRRLLRGERVYEAHRSHVYQRLVQGGWSHGAVTACCMAVTVALGVAAWAAARGWLPPHWAVVAAVGLLAVAGRVALHAASVRASAGGRVGMRET